MNLVGVDIGGTSITAGRVEDGKVVGQFTVETLSHREREEILNDFFLAIGKVITPDTVSIGIGSPGVIDTKQGIIHEIVNIPCWRDLPLKNITEKKFGLPVFLENDANCYTLAVHRFGVGKEFKDIVGITLGTGLGTGIIINGKLYSGYKSGAGEFGQLPYRDGIYEDYCSGKFFSSVKNETGITIFQKAMNGDKEAISKWEEFGTHMAALLQLVIYSLAPELIVFGGSISKGYDLFKTTMIERMEDFNLQELVKNLSIAPDNNPLNPLLGAAALYYNEFPDRD